MKYDQVHAVRKREEAMRREDGLSATAPAQPMTEPEKEETDEE